MEEQAMQGLPITTIGDQPSTTRGKPNDAPCLSGLNGVHSLDGGI
jgi:hypothetical protein